MIKVEHTKAHNIVLFETSAGERTKQVLVTEAKLVLVECKPKEGLLYIPNWKHEEGKLHLLTKNVSLVDAVYKAFKPTLISRTERIMDGDWILEYQFVGIPYQIIQVTKNDLIRCLHNHKNHNCFKILALPEHFSPEQLQMIVDGKLKDGMTVLLKCENKTIRYGSCTKGEGVTMDSLVIKLNPHITIYNLENRCPHCGKLI